MILTESIGIGLLLGFFFYECVGFSPGGLVVPGYIALYWDRPLMIVTTLGISLLTYGVVHVLSHAMILYSRRRFLLMILTGFAFRWLFEQLVIQTKIVPTEMDPIGYIIPGLIANEMNQQGILPTVSSLVILSVAVRGILILLHFLGA